MSFMSLRRQHFVIMLKANKANHMIYFLGSSYAAVTLKEAARRRGLPLTDDIHKADLIFVSEDTPTDETGNRDQSCIKNLILEADRKRKHWEIPVVVTSQVTPGFMHEINSYHVRGPLYHQAETLRIEDGIQRAMYPEMFIVGTNSFIDHRYQEYLDAFECPILKMSFEEAEFCKIAINAFLISQIETTNMLSAYAEKVAADWGSVSKALRHDSRIGKYAYLTPGRWQNSKHLLRDYVTILEIEARGKSDSCAFDATANEKLLEAWK